MTKTTSGVGLAAHAPNSSQHLINTIRGPFSIQVSWPLGWNSNGTPDDLNIDDVPVIYLVDGNAYFFTATDIVRRLQFAWGKKAVVVGIGYPVTDSIFAPRRGADLTPPSRDLKTKHPLGRDGNPQEHITYGEAENFLGVITEDIMPFVETRVLPRLPIKRMTKVLFGHSFGGLFSLYTLFTRPALFDIFIAASPSIWWNKCSIVREQEKAFLESDTTARPNLYITYGSYEQYPPKRGSESEDQYEKRKKNSAEKGMEDNALELKGRMEASGKLGELWIQELVAEDHGSAAVSGVQRAIMKLLGEW